MTSHGADQTFVPGRVVLGRQQDQTRRFRTEGEGEQATARLAGDDVGLPKHLHLLGQRMVFRVDDGEAEARGDRLDFVGVATTAFCVCAFA